MRHSSRFITYVFVRSHCIGLFSTETESTAQSTRFTCVALVFRFLVRHREKRGRVSNLKQKASLKTSNKARTGHRCIAQILELYPCLFWTPHPHPQPPPPDPGLSYLPGSALNTFGLCVRVCVCVCVCVCMSVCLHV